MTDSTQDESPLELFDRVATDLSRRGFLSTTAKAGVGGLALSTLGAGAAAADGGGGSGSENGDGGSSVVDILNYALALERLEATYYQKAVGTRVGDVPESIRVDGHQFDERDVETSESAKFFEHAPLRYSTYQSALDVADHEVYHVQFLEKVLGEKANAPTEFSFPDTAYESVPEFVKLARTLEDIGVSAYAGAAPALAQAELQQVGGDLSKLEATPAALGIHSIEARHASYFRVLNSQRPWPFGTDENLADVAVDDPRTTEEVLKLAKPFIQG